MTDISSPAVAVIASNSWVTYATTKWLKMIPLKIIEYFDSQLLTIRLTVYLLVFMQGIIIRLKICMCLLSVCYIWIHAVSSFIFQCLIRLSKFLLEAQEFKLPKGMLFVFSVSTTQ